MRNKLANFEAEHFVPCCIKLLFELIHAGLIFLRLEQTLNLPLDKSLFKTASVILLLAILQTFALLFPVELMVDSLRCHCNGQVDVSQFDDL